ncbi:chitin-binding type-2 domain-containing protein [Trichonephila inaurata madagascariensis]|uniref:Chitin-binding type-2 domain-containing protein n=1 Tax=Trichonephila inaurata madagascariensis TaxID=2747483 RepID=A0A8X6Y2U8_9ARAC|nr:chitin-binding type-2 domain-containing protein [Trichonephila inaurata madagascariensis]
MKILFFALVPFIWMNVAKGFYCPDDGDISYYVDTASNCEYYHLCINSLFLTYKCPSGMAFDSLLETCTDSANVTCIHLEVFRTKRSVNSNDIVHSIPKVSLREGLSELFDVFISTLKTTLEGVPPTFYESLEEAYFAHFDSIKNGLAPIYEMKILPKVEGFQTYVQNVSERIFEKAYKAWEASNSTHINLASFEDIFSDVSNDLSPLVEFGRYLSSRMESSTRVKRSIDRDNMLPEFILEYFRPIVKSLFSNTINLIVGGEDSLMSKLFLPSIIEVFENPETRFDLRRIFWSAKSAYAPVVYELIKRQTHTTPRGTVIRIPHAVVQKAMNQFSSETEPLIRKVLIKHLPAFLRRAARFDKLMFKTFDAIEKHASDDISQLKSNIFSFIVKYINVLEGSGVNYWNTYTYTEMINDLKPIKINIINIIFNYMSNSPNTLFNFLFSADSMLTRFL